MDPIALMRRIVKSPRVLSDPQHGFIGLKLQPDPRSDDPDDETGGDPTHFEVRVAMQRRQAVATVVESILNVIVENGAGATVTQVTLNGLPTAGTVLSLPFGAITIPPLSVSGGSVVPATPPPSPSNTPQSASAPQTSAPSTATASAAASNSPLTSASSVPTTAAAASSVTSISASSTSSASTSSSSTSSSTTSTTRSRTSPSTTFHTSHSTSRTSTSGVGIIVAPSSVSSTASSTSSQPAASSSAAVAAPVSQVNTPTVVGGVVGGVAGFALFLALIMLLARWRKHHMNGARELRSNPDSPARPDTGRSDVAMAGASAVPWGAGAAAGGARDDPFADPHREQRGFQRLGGRKLESVLVSGGDGYGEPSRTRGVRDASFYRDSHGDYGGPHSATSSIYQGTGMRESNTTGGGGGAGRGTGVSAASAVLAPPVPQRRNPGTPFRASPGDDSSPSPPPELPGSPPDVVLMRPSPARQIVHTAGYSTPPHDPLGRLRQDPIGRSHPSLDGSRGSRGSKFAEDLGR